MNPAPTITGTVLVLPRPGTERLVEKLADARGDLHEVSWRLYDVQVVPESDTERGTWS